MATIKRIGKDRLGIPIWQARYRRTTGGKQVMRHFHAHTRAEVERAILMDCNKSGIGLKWSEGVKVYLDAKLAENRNQEAMGHVRRAADVFMDVIGDIAIEDTTPELFKEFMQKVVVRPVLSPKGKEIRKSGPKVANHHRKELLTVARYLLNHTGKIATIPFLNVPRLPVKTVKRKPVYKDDVGTYLDALPPHVRRPVLMVLVYGLRSTAICNIKADTIESGYINAVDKNKVERRIPIDPFLKGIVREAVEHRNAFPSPAPRLFVNKAGLAWNHMSLLRAAQRSWTARNLEPKNIHQFRHTLGTLASKSFTPRMVQAAMGHQSPDSAQAYFHPDEEMAAEVREKIITILSQELVKTPENAGSSVQFKDTKNGGARCPLCPFISLYLKERQ